MNIFDQLDELDELQRKKELYEEKEKEIIQSFKEGITITRAIYVDDFIVIKYNNVTC